MRKTHVVILFFVFIQLFIYFMVLVDVSYANQLTSFTPSPSIVSVTLLDSTKKPLADIYVTIQDKSGSTQTNTTDGRGNLSMLKGGTISAVNVDSRSIPVNLVVNNSETIEIKGIANADVVVPGQSFTKQTFIWITACLLSIILGITTCFYLIRKDFIPFYIKRLFKRRMVH